MMVDEIRLREEVESLKERLRESHSAQHYLTYTIKEQEKIIVGLKEELRNYRQLEEEVRILRAEKE